MSRVENVNRAIASLRDELPVLLGEGWPAFESKLNALEEGLAAGRIREVLFPNNVLALFRTCEPAHRRLVAMIREAGPGDGNRDPLEGTTKGIRQKLRALHNPAVTRYADIGCPRLIARDARRAQVVVRLCVRPPIGSEAVAEMDLRAGTNVTIEVDAPAFECLNEPRQKTRVERDADSAPVVFDLRPRATAQSGHARINLDFFQDGMPVGTASIPVQIVAAGSVIADDDGAARLHGLTLSLVAQPEPPDLTLMIRYDEMGRELRFELLRGNTPLELAPVQLRDDPRATMARYYEQLVALQRRRDPTAELELGHSAFVSDVDVEKRVRKLGQLLWDELIPDDLKALYARERSRWRGMTMMVYSDEPWFPWELVWPYDTEADWEDDEPWCTSLYMTRWLRRGAQGSSVDGPPTARMVKTLACVAPTDSGLPSAQKEREFLTAWAAKVGVQDVSPPVASWHEVEAMLGADGDGGADWVHVAAHGTFRSVTPELDAAVWLEDRIALTPQHIVGPAIERQLRRRRTAFVLNACHTGRQGIGLTGLGGWAQRLIAKGAGLFVGPLWTVGDRRAIEFATVLYTELAEGKTVAEAVHAARLAARRQGDPTWLAYSVYAHPRARLALAPTAEGEPRGT